MSEPRVFVRATDDYMELSARFVVPLRTARTAKEALTRRVVERLSHAGIEIASPTEEVTVLHGGDRHAEQDRPRPSDRDGPAGRPEQRED